MAGNDVGTLFYKTTSEPDPSMELFVKMFTEKQKGDVAVDEYWAKEEDHCLKAEAAAEENYLKAEECWDRRLGIRLCPNKYLASQKILLPHDHPILH